MNVKEFRGIKKCNEPMKFSEFSVLIGRNNSGKSSILEALSLLPLPHSMFPLPYHGYSRTELLSNLHGGTSSMIYAYSGQASINYTIEHTPKSLYKNWKITLRDDGGIVLEIPDLPQKRLIPDPAHTVAQVLGISSKKRDYRNEVNKMVFFIPNDSSFMQALLAQMMVERNRNMIMKTGAHARVAKEIINKCVDDRYTEIFFAPQLSARKELPDGNVLYVRIRDLGDGIEKVALLVLWLEALNPALILWDDFEGSAHPTLIKVLLDWLCKKKWQIILSTHSIDVLSALLDTKPMNAKVIQLKKTSEDILIHSDLSLEELENLIEANQDPRILVDLLEL